MTQQSGRLFPKTQWTQVEQAGRDAADGRQAMASLLQVYLPALRIHLIRKKGLAAEKAEDLLQSFVARNILERGLLAKADRSRGCKFRSFLLTALDYFLINEKAREGAKKRSARTAVVDADSQSETIPSRQASSEFDVAWARQVIDQTLQRMHAQCVSSSRIDMWELFGLRVLGPILYGEEPMHYEEVVSRLGYSSPIQASNVLISAKRMFQRILRQVVGEYAAGVDNVEREIDELMAALSIARAG